MGDLVYIVLRLCCELCCFWLFDWCLVFLFGFPGTVGFSFDLLLFYCFGIPLLFGCVIVGFD